VAAVAVAAVAAAEAVAVGGAPEALEGAGSCCRKLRVMLAPPP